MKLTRRELARRYEKLPPASEERQVLSRVMSYKPKEKELGRIWVHILLTVAVVVALVVTLLTGSVVVRVFAIATALVCLIILAMLVTTMLIKYYEDCDHAVMHDGGFAWVRHKPDGDIIDVEMVKYADVDRMEVKEKQVTGTNTNMTVFVVYKLKLIGHDGKVLFAKRSKYYLKNFWSGNPQTVHTLRSQSMKNIEKAYGRTRKEKSATGHGQRQRDANSLVCHS